MSEVRKLWRKVVESNGNRYEMGKRYAVLVPYCDSARPAFIGTVDNTRRREALKLVVMTGRKRGGEALVEVYHLSRKDKLIFKRDYTLDENEYNEWVSEHKAGL